jgi:hypothetical protein
VKFVIPMSRSNGRLEDQETYEQSGCRSPACFETAAGPPPQNQGKDYDLSPDRAGRPSHDGAEFAFDPTTYRNSRRVSTI